jgi:hypothetical protein
MIQTDILKNKYVQVVFIVAILYILYKLLNSDLFKGIGKGAEGVGEAVEGVGKLIGSYAEAISIYPEKFNVWVGIVDDPKDKPFLDLYENLPFSQVNSITQKPFNIDTKWMKKNIYNQKYFLSFKSDSALKPIATQIKNAEGTLTYDEDLILGAIDKLYSWYDFMKLAERYKPLTNQSLRAYLDKALTSHQKAEVGRIMNSKPFIKYTPNPNYKGK